MPKKENRANGEFGSGTQTQGKGAVLVTLEDSDEKGMYIIYFIVSPSLPHPIRV